MEKSCSFSQCNLKPAFICKCKSPSVAVCDFHFSSHIRQKGLNHQYEFISACNSPSPRPNKILTSPIKNEEIKKLISTLPESAKKSLFPSSPKTTNLISSIGQNEVKQSLEEKIYYSEEEYYEGEIENGREHGQGKFHGNLKRTNCEQITSGQLTFSGEWRFGLPHGKGELEFSGCKLKATWFQGSATGDGSVTLSNGDEYTGELFECKYSGNGKYRFHDSEISGYFKDHTISTPSFFTCIDKKYTMSLEKLKNKDIKVPERFKLISEIFFSPLIRHSDPESSIENCHFFKNNSLQVMEINIESLEKSEYSIETSQRFPSLGAMCEVEGCIFQAGGLIGEKSVGLTFILKPGTWEIRWLDSCNKRATPCALPLNRKVYIFGGADLFLNFIKESQVFDFDTFKWSALPDLPLPSDNMAGGVVGKFLVVSGYMHSKVYVFDSEFEEFSEVLELPDFKDKVFCVLGGVAYLMCCKKIYEAKVGNPFEWKFVRDVGFHCGWATSVPVRRGNCFYWYTTEKEIWKFDKDTKAVFLLKKFK